MGPKKVKGKKQLALMIKVEAIEALDKFVAKHYTDDEKWGAKSEVVTNAIMSFCSTGTTTLIPPKHVTIQYSAEFPIQGTDIILHFEQKPKKKEVTEE